MSEACGYCGRSPALGDAAINDTRYCHWEWARGATCYTARQALDRPRTGTFMDALGILATHPYGRPCVRCRGDATDWCPKGEHVYCSIHGGRGCLDPCEGCEEGEPSVGPPPPELLAEQAKR